MLKRLSLLAVVVLVAVAAALFAVREMGPSVSISVASGSENRPLEPILQDWAKGAGVDLNVTYLGSVDISRAVSRGTDIAFDAVWPAHSLWIELGDTKKTVSSCASILRSPVVLGLRQSIARDLGWIDRQDITIQDISEAARSGKFRLAMTSATQSNSGASAYIGFLYALAGNPDVLTMENLSDEALLQGVRDLLAEIDRSSGSSGWLGDALVANPDAYDSMMNYEAVVLEANQQLVAKGEEPLHLIYPANGLAVADSPLCKVDRGDDDKDEAFAEMQAHLLSKDVQAELLTLGRRTGLIGAQASTSTGGIWNADWGVDPDRAVAPVPTPASEVIREALRLYQTELRKPSLTIWVLDVSGSMEGEPLAQLKNAMTLLLDPESAQLNLLQPSARDITVVIPFSGRPKQPFIVTGIDPGETQSALDKVRGLRASGGTDLYGALAEAFKLLEPYAKQDRLDDYLPAIVAMTDGASSSDNRGVFLNYMNNLSFGRDVPVHAIAFGKADEDQLRELNDATIGRLFKAGDDLAKALRSAKGYN